MAEGVKLDAAQAHAPQFNIIGLVVHKLLKEKNQPAEIELRKNPIAVGKTATRLVEQLQKLYSERPQKGFGKFEADFDNFPMGRMATEYYVDKTTEFYELSRRMMEHLKARATNEQFATGGYIVIAHVDNGATHWLLALMVTEVLGTAITEGLEIVDSVHLDMTNLRVAGRINLTDWQKGVDRYISFLKGKTDVSNYFKLFLGCNDVLEHLRETQKLVLIMRSFASDEIDDATERGTFLDDVHAYLAELAKKKQTISLQEFTNRFSPGEPEKLMERLLDAEHQLSDGFIPDRRAASALATFKARSNHWKIEFDRDGIRSGDVDYNEDDNEIILRNIPEALQKRLIEELRSAQELEDLENN